MWQILDVTFSKHGMTDGVAQSCPFTVHTPAQRWHYASLSSEPHLQNGGDTIAVKIAAVVEDGPIGFGLISPENISRYIAPERVLNRSLDIQEANFLVPANERFRVCVRTGDADRSARARILEVSWTQEHRLIKEAQVSKFSHWYYTTDLGDGVVARATVHDEPGWTQANAVARAIFTYLLAQYVGPINGSKVLDVACNAGHFSFFFARMGADVYGFDHDSNAIEQAQFIADQLHKNWAGSTKFEVAGLEQFTSEEQYDLVFCSGLFYHLRDPIGGAQRLSQLTKRWILLQSCVSNRLDPVFELSDPERWPFCADWEFCLVPSAPMVQAIFERVGLRVHALFRLRDFIVDENTNSVKIRSGPLTESEQVARSGDPIYMVLEKTGETGEREGR